MVIGRRGLGFRERVPLNLRKYMKKKISDKKFNLFLGSKEWSKWGKIDYRIQRDIKNIKKGGDKPGYKDYSYIHYRRKILLAKVA
jgi:hypothetical protein